MKEHKRIRLDGECFKTVDTNGCIKYFKGMVFHRENGPAVIYPNGSQLWYVNGLMHREEGPALVDKMTGYNEYYIDGAKYSEQEFLKRKINLFLSDIHE